MLPLIPIPSARTIRTLIWACTITYSVSRLHSAVETWAVIETAKFEETVEMEVQARLNCTTDNECESLETTSKLTARNK